MTNYVHAEYVDHMGSDASVVDAARISFDKLSTMFTEDQNTSLIKFLARGLRESEWQGLIEAVQHTNSEVDAENLIKGIRNMSTHWTPFAHTAITLRMNAPIPIRTQCFKHKQGLVENEESRRYISCKPEVYIPEYFRSVPEGSIKQGSSGMHMFNEFWLVEYESKTKDLVETYEEMIEDGVCPEQARLILPQGAIVNWVWTGNLFAFANVFIKRSDPHAQKEVQDVARDIDKVIRPLFPVSWAALVD